jgi:hypothetical protein
MVRTTSRRKSYSPSIHTPEEAYAKETELVATYKGDPLCMNLRDGGKGGFDYIRDNGLNFKIPKKFLTGRIQGSKNLVEENSDPCLMCKYGCDRTAKWVLGKKQTPCGSNHHGKCPEYQKQKSAPKFTSFENPAGLKCAYGCEKLAGFLVGASGSKPCCSESFYRCPGHWNKIGTTNTEKYGGVSSLSSPEIQSKQRATMKERHGVENPNQSEALRAKRIATNRIRYGGDSPMASKEVASRSGAARKSKSN